MATLTPGDHYFTAEGVTFHYRAAGTGPILVAQSVGWGPSASYLWTQLTPLESRFTVIYFEPRGSGTSTRPDDETRMSSTVMAHDLEHLRTHLAIDRIPVLLGHSNGGAIALTYATRYPSRVGKLILINSQIQGSPQTDNFARFSAQRKDDPVYGPALQTLMRVMAAPPETDAQFGEMLAALAPYYFAQPGKAHLLVESMQPDVQPPRAWAFRRQALLDEQEPFPHLAEAGAVEAKTLILWGVEDAFCPLLRGRELDAALRDSKMVEFEACGHFPWFENTEGFWKAVDEFLAD